MQYRRVGKWRLKLPEISLGGARRSRRPASRQVSTAPLPFTSTSPNGSATKSLPSKSAARRRFSDQIDLLQGERAVGMELFMELPSSKASQLLSHPRLSFVAKRVGGADSGG